MILSESNRAIEDVLLSEMHHGPYCREANRGVVKRIEKGFDNSRLGLPTLNKRNGHYYVIDGNHRVDAMKAAGVKKCLCFVVEVPYEQEVKMYYKHHNKHK